MKDFSSSKIPRLFELMSKQNIKGSDITKDLKISSSTISSWKVGYSAPSSGTLMMLANYLNTTVEYLKGETDINEPTKERKSPITENFTFEELEIINAYRNHPEVARRVVRRALGLEGISKDATTAAYGGKDTQVGEKKE